MRGRVRGRVSNWRHTKGIDTSDKSSGVEWNVFIRRESAEDIPDLHLHRAVRLDDPPAGCDCLRVVQVQDCPP
jgi:hypothetical protein